MINPGDEVAILGLGVSGRAAARYALWRGARVRISDSRPEERFLVEERELLELPGVSWEAGGHSFEFLSRARRILISPGVDLSLPLLQSLAQAGVAITGELAVAARELRVPTVAITGTNGKTTTTTLIGELLAAGGIKPFVGGNIGTPIYDFLREPRGVGWWWPKSAAFSWKAPGILPRGSASCSTLPRTIWIATAASRSTGRSRCASLPISEPAIWPSSTAMTPNACAWPAPFPESCRPSAAERTIRRG
jgi:hypothetical protein